MNDADEKAFEAWANKAGYVDLEYAHEGMIVGRYYSEVAYDGWNAACEWRDSQLGEVVMYQCRMQPTWTDRQPWTVWSECTKGTYEDYKRVPENSDWRFESRALYTTPPAAQINQQLVDALIYAKRFLNNKDHDIEYVNTALAATQMRGDA